VSETREGERCAARTSRDARPTPAITAFEAGAFRNPGGPNPMTHKNDALLVPPRRRARGGEEPRDGETALGFVEHAEESIFLRNAFSYEA
jgi:hypothetical protein